ncbi:MAG: hypothetical protein COC23_05355, partial [Hyphomicrobiales bacterium]
RNDANEIAKNIKGGTVILETKVTTPLSERAMIVDAEQVAQRSPRVPILETRKWLIALWPDFGK